MGAPIEASSIVKNSEVFEVWPANWDSVTAFLHCETQWRSVATLSALIWTGIEYPALDVVLRRLNSPAHVFDDVRLMERAALDVFREVRA